METNICIVQKKSNWKEWKKMGKIQNRNFKRIQGETSDLRTIISVINDKCVGIVSTKNLSDSQKIKKLWKKLLKEKMILRWQKASLKRAKKREKNKSEINLK